MRIGIEKVGKGRGVFARETMYRGETVESCPLVLMRRASVMLPLDHYVYEWSPTKYALALGYGSLYNHSFDPNAFYEFDTKAKLIRIQVRRIIRRGDEIRINYNGDPEDQTPVQFLGGKICRPDGITRG